MSYDLHVISVRPCSSPFQDCSATNVVGRLSQMVKNYTQDGQIELERCKKKKNRKGAVILCNLSRRTTLRIYRSIPLAYFFNFVSQRHGETSYTKYCHTYLATAENVARRVAETIAKRRTFCDDFKLLSASLRSHTSPLPSVNACAMFHATCLAMHCKQVVRNIGWRDSALT